MSRLAPKAEKIAPWRYRTTSLIAPTTTNSQRSWQYVEHFVMIGAQGPERVKLVIHHDSYQHQSFAHACLFDPQRRAWNIVATLSGEQLSSWAEGCSSGSTMRSYYSDAKTLLSMVADIIGDPLAEIRFEEMDLSKPSLKVEDIWLEDQQQ